MAEFLENVVLQEIRFREEVSMVLSRENMEKYSKIENEINRINRKLDYYANNPVSGEHGVVKGSMEGFPYAECHFVVSAPNVKTSDERHKKVQNLVIELGEKKKRYEDLQLEIDFAIEDIDDMEMRQIFQYKYIEHKTDYEIGKLLGYDRSTISKKLDRFFESQLSHNSHS